MKTAVALLPLDDRPVNYDYPTYLATLAGFELHIPPREWLGNPWKTSQHSHLVDWITAQAHTADVLIVSLDTLAYGGLIPSRTSNERYETVLERLSILKMVKLQRPEVSILAFNVILRISRANSSEEEKEYWAVYGSEMFRLSYLEHKVSLGEASPPEQAEKNDLANHIPREVYDDYLAGRKRNHQVNLAMVDWLEQGIFDYLVLPQDDTAEYGWNIAEAREIQATIRWRNLTNRAITYPGADEIGCLLLASAACRRASFSPKIYPHYSSVNSAAVTTSYEDRPIHELIKAHLAPLGGVIASSPEKADLQLYVNAPAHSQGDASLQLLIWQVMLGMKTDASEKIKPYPDTLTLDPLFQPTQAEMQTPERSVEEFLRAMWVDLDSKLPVALADVAFVNGADLQLGNLLLQPPEVTRLTAFAGWNTAGNTLGCTLAHAVLRLLASRNRGDPEQTRAHVEFLFLRILDDYYYQARERTHCVWEDLPALGLQPTMERLPPAHIEQVEQCVQERLQRAACELEQLFIKAGVIKSVKVDNIHLPWHRLFEVGFNVHVEL